MIAAYTYDGAGNIASSYLKDGLSVDAPVNCTFNELNQMTEYTDSNGVKTTYTYYPNGLRKTKIADGITTTYYYDGQNAIIEADNGSLKYRNIYGMNQIARQDAAGNINYFLYNGHGDVVKLVDSAENIKNSYSYDIYGKVTNAVENGIPNPMRYAGQMYDSESGLYYLRARYYDPRIGRFISEDTNKGDINNPSSLNLYTYCWGNPLRYVDLDGHASTGVAEVLYRNPVLTFATGVLSYFAYRMSPYINMLSSNANKLQAAADAGNKTAEKYNDGNNSSGDQDPDPNGDWNKNKNFDKIVKMDKDALWNKYERHIFSRDHIKEGIMNLGESRTDIYNKFVDVVKSEIGNFQSGTTQIRTYINGYQAEIKININEGVIRSIDGYVGWSSRVIEHLIVK